MLATFALSAILSTQTAGAPQPLTVCEVLANPTRYAGKRIRVRAEVIQTRHGILLDDPRCPDSHIALGEEIDRNPSGNAEFFAASMHSMFKGAPSVSAVIEGKYWYRAARYTGSRLDDFQAQSFKLGKPRR